MEYGTDLFADLTAATYTPLSPLQVSATAADDSFLQHAINDQRTPAGEDAASFQPQHMTDADDLPAAAADGRERAVRHRAADSKRRHGIKRAVDELRRATASTEETQQRIIQGAVGYCKQQEETIRRLTLQLQQRQQAPHNSVSNTDVVPTGTQQLRHDAISYSVPCPRFASADQHAEALMHHPNWAHYFTHTPVPRLFVLDGLEASWAVSTLCTTLQHCVFIIQQAARRQSLKAVQVPLTVAAIPELQQVNTANVAMVRVNAARGILDYSSAFAAITGYERHQLVDSHVSAPPLHFYKEPVFSQHLDRLNNSRFSIYSAITAQQRSNAAPLPLIIRSYITTATGDVLVSLDAVWLFHQGVDKPCHLLLVSHPKYRALVQRKPATTC